MTQTILVAEDEPMIQRILVFKLKTEGYRVLQAETGPQVIEILNKNKPDLILLDATLPEIDSFKILQKIRSIDGFKDLPVFVLTQTHEPWQIDRAKESGATQCVVKPFKPTVLAKQIKTLFENPT
jgi:DNA-binding response OmpR family regulator